MSEEKKVDTAPTPTPEADKDHQNTPPKPVTPEVKK